MIKTQNLLALIDKEYHLDFLEYLYYGVSTPEFYQYMVQSSGCKIALDEAARHNRGFFRFTQKRE
jgi:hypothetical protein